MSASVSFPRRAAAWAAAAALGIPTAVAAVLRAGALAGDATWSQFWAATVDNFVFHAATVLAVLAGSWLVVRSSSRGKFAQVLVVVAGSVVLTWTWAMSTSQTPLAGALNAPVWLGWALLALNAVIMWRWCGVLAGSRRNDGDR